MNKNNGLLDDSKSREELLLDAEWMCMICLNLD